MPAMTALHASPLRALSQRVIVTTRTWWQVDRGRLVHVLKTVLALVLSLWLCMRLELSQPRTAMVSVVILMMHQQAGPVIARGFYRAAGMLIGSLAGLLLMVLFPQQPVPFFLALAVWAGVCVWGAAYYRNYQAYGFVLAGYAIAITAVPAWSQPHTVFDNVTEAFFEVLVGVVSASLVSALILPQHVGQALFGAGQRHASSFIGFVRRMLRGELEGADVGQMHVQLVGERALIENLRSGAVFEDPALRLGNPIMAQLNHDFLDASAGFHAMRQVRERAQRWGDAAALGAITPLFAELEAVLPGDPVGPMLSLAQFQALRDHLQVFMPQLPERIAVYRETLAADDESARRAFAAAASSLYFAAADLQRYVEGFLAIREQPRLRAASDAQSFKMRSRRIINTANAMAAQASGWRAFIAVLIVAALWVASGWTGGASAVVTVTITSALFAVFPRPAAATRQIFWGCLAGWAAAFVFTFFLAPRLDGFLLLALAIAPFIAIGSYANSFMQTAVFGLGFNIYFCFIANVTNPLKLDPVGMLDTGFALLAGIAVAWLAFAVIVPYAGDWATSNYLRQIRRMVSRTAAHAPLRDDLLLRFESGMRDFTIQAAARPVDGPAGRRQLLGWAFVALEVGRGLIRLREESQRYPAGLPAEWPQTLRELRHAMAQLFAQVTPEHHAQALLAVRHALAILPRRPRFDPAPEIAVGFHMRALLQAMELTLLDDSMPLYPKEKTAP